MQSIPARPINTESLTYDILKTPVGLLGIAMTEKGLSNVQSRIKSEADYCGYLGKLYSVRPHRNAKKLACITTQFEKYFNSELETFSLPLDIVQGTPFQRKVWRKLQTIPYGETRSYLWLAKAVGKPKAHRAAGNANGGNPIPILIPCHRVILSDGGLGGYARGTSIKKFLLKLESH